MNLAEEADRIQLYRHLQQPRGDAQAAIDWAVAALVAGHEGAPLDMLASFERGSTWDEVSGYFAEAMRLFGCQPWHPAELPARLAEGIAEEMVTGKMKPVDGADHLYRLALQETYLPLDVFSRWFDFNIQIWDAFYDEREPRDVEAAILAEARLLAQGYDAYVARQRASSLPPPEPRLTAPSPPTPAPRPSLRSLDRTWWDRFVDWLLHR